MTVERRKHMISQQGGLRFLILSIPRQRCRLTSPKWMFSPRTLLLRLCPKHKGTMKLAACWKRLLCLALMSYPGWSCQVAILDPCLVFYWALPSHLVCVWASFIHRYSAYEACEHRLYKGIIMSSSFGHWSRTGRLEGWSEVPYSNSFFHPYADTLVCLLLNRNADFLKVAPL